MPRVNWDDTSDNPSQDREPVPEAKYRVKVHEAEEEKTKLGDEMWKITLVIQEGEHEGRKVWDNIVFSRAAMPRAKHIFQGLGLDTRGTQDLEPRMIVGREAFADIEVDEYKGKKKNKVAYEGYSPCYEDIPL